MAKIKSREEMEKAIVGAFLVHADADVLHTTPDGNVFVQKNHADFHISRNPGMKVSAVERKDYEDEIAIAQKAIDAAKPKVAEVKNDADKAIAEVVANTISDAVEKATMAPIDSAASTDADEKTDADPKYGKMKLDELKTVCIDRKIVFDEAAAKRKDLILLLEEADAKTV